MSEPRVYQLREPVQFGEERIERLTMKRNARSMKDLGIKMGGDGSMVFEPYALARVGVHMAGQPNAVLDMMDPADVFALAGIVMDFFAPGQGIGPTA